MISREAEQRQQVGRIVVAVLGYASFKSPSAEANYRARKRRRVLRAAKLQSSSDELNIAFQTVVVPPSCVGPGRK